MKELKVSQILSREQLLTPREVPIRKVELPALGGFVWVKGMTAKERGQFEKSFDNIDGTKNKKRVSEVRERMVIICACDEDRTPMFTIRDLEALGKQEINTIEKIVIVAQELCGMSDGDIEELAGNSDGIEEDS